MVGDGRGRRRGGAAGDGGVGVIVHVLHGGKGQGGHLGGVLVGLLLLLRLLLLL